MICDGCELALLVWILYVLYQVLNIFNNPFLSSLHVAFSSFIAAHSNLILKEVPSHSDSLRHHQPQAMPKPVITRLSMECVSCLQAEDT